MPDASDVDFHKPIPVRVAKRVIQSATGKFARIQELEPGFLIESLVKKLGGALEYREAFGKSRSSEAIRVFAQKDFTIYVATDTSPLRDRFTIAHELGHYLIHYPMVVRAYGVDSKMLATRFVDQEDKDLVRTEWEANWFAAELLMPEDEFRKKWKEYGEPLAVASYFSVTAPAAKVRAQSLDLL